MSKFHLPVGNLVEWNSKKTLLSLMSLDLLDSYDLKISTPINQISTWPHYCKREDKNLSHSFKDRSLSLICQHLSINHRDRVYLETSGNAGKALLAHLQDHNLNIQILTENLFSDLGYEKFNLDIRKLDSQKNIFSKIFEVIMSWLGFNDRAWQMVSGQRLNHKIQAGFYLAQPSIYTNVLGLLGYVKISLEIFRQLNAAPDAIITCVINSDNAIGQWLGYFWLKKAGLINKIPKFYLVEQKKRIQHFNYPEAWKIIKKFSQVAVVSVDLSDIGQASLLAYQQLLKTKTLANNDTLVIIKGGK